MPHPRGLLPDNPLFMPPYNLYKGFSKLSPPEKRRLVLSALEDDIVAEETLLSFQHPDGQIQKVLSEFSENTLSNYVLPYGVAPNFLINGKVYMVPMVIEESSVVAAASSAAAFWAGRGGFTATVEDMEKVGQLHFIYSGDVSALMLAEAGLSAYLRQRAKPLTDNMEKRGGGIVDIRIKDFSAQLANYFQLHVTFNTADAMGANFINTVLEEFAAGLSDYFSETPGFSGDEAEPLMAILSNYTPNCLAKVSVCCDIAALGNPGGMEAGEFVRRFVQAVRIAEVDVYRATTHNKGIMNGVDAVILATGNDFRAVEAGVHAFAARSGQYRSLSRADASEGQFRFTLEIPLALGTLGGLTSLHPLASLSLKILGRPSAKELMMIAASAGLANNFAAVRSLVTTGIQAGHMRMHLPNLLKLHHASPEEAQRVTDHFAGKKISSRAVEDFLQNLRKKQTQ